MAMRRIASFRFQQRKGVGVKIETKRLDDGTYMASSRGVEKTAITQDEAVRQVNKVIQEQFAKGDQSIQQKMVG